MLTDLFFNICIALLGKSSPTTDTRFILLVKNEEERQIYVAAPPTILSVFPKGVSIASKATVPTTNTLISIFFANIFYYLMVCAIFTPVLKKHSSLAQLVRASDC